MSGVNMPWPHGEGEREMMEDRMPPFSEESEQGLLGCAIMAPDQAIPLMLGAKIEPEAFYVPANRLVFEAVMALWNEQNPKRRFIDVLMVESRLKQTDTLMAIGGPAFLDRLTDRPTWGHAAGYLNLVWEAWIRRRAINEAHQFLSELWQDGEAGLKTVMQAPDRFSRLVPTLDSDETPEEVMAASIEKWRKAKRKEAPAIGLTLPWESVTKLMCGLEPGLTILAGKQSSGKTTVEDQIACHVAGTLGVGVGRVTLDSTREGLLNRAMCRMAGASLPKLKFGHGGESQLSRLEDAKTLLAKMPMWITSSHRDIREIRSWARTMKLKHNIGLLTVDYVQIVRAEEMGRNEWDQCRKVTHVSGTLKDLSFELGIPVIALSQLSRAIDKADREPEMSDLRDSGALEQDADKLLFVYKDKDVAESWEQRDAEATKKKRPTWMKLEKHKNGETGKLPFIMRPHYFRFDESNENFADLRQTWEGEDVEL